MRTSAEIDLIAPALVKALANIVPPTRTKVGRASDGSTYLYADLADVLAAAKAPLATFELVIMQESITTPSAVITMSRLQHSSGQFFESEPLELPRLGEMSAQETGTLITYGRRYQAEGLLGMSATHDSDAASAAASSPLKAAADPGVSAGQPGPEASSPKASPRPRGGASGPGKPAAKPKPPSGAQIAGIKNRIAELGWAHDRAEKFTGELLKFRGKAITTNDQASALIDALEREIRKKAKA